MSGWPDLWGTATETVERAPPRRRAGAARGPLECQRCACRSGDRHAVPRTEPFPVAAAGFVQMADEPAAGPGVTQALHDPRFVQRKVVVHEEMAAPNGKVHQRGQTMLAACILPTFPASGATPCSADNHKS